MNYHFRRKYPFWHNDDFVVKNCLFTEGARAALWYSNNLQMTDTLVEAPKMFREMDGIRLENVQLPYALETLWFCRNVELKNVKVDKGDYLFVHGENIRIDDFEINGNYSFQYCKNVEIRNAVINSKDCFLEYGKRDGLRLCIERGIFRLAFQKSAPGELQDFRYTAALLCPRSDYGKLHDDRRCRPRF